MSGEQDTIRARSLWITAPRTPELRSELVPPPGPGEVRVRAIASAPSAGTEMLVYRGQVPESLLLDLPTLAGSFAFPIKYGYATVGSIIDAGPDVEDWSPGDLVFVHHPHQSAFTVPAAFPIRLPNGLGPIPGVFTANVETAVNVLLDTPLHLGETVIVFGQGTVGLLIVQLLKRAGAGCVLVVEPLERRREMARRVGADDVLAPGDDLVGRIRSLSGGRGADVAIETSGSGTALQAAIDTVADEGTVVAVSWYGTKPVTLSLGERFHRGRVSIRSSQVGRVNPALAPRWDRDRRTALVTELLSELTLAELVTHRTPFGDAPRLYALLDEHPEEVVQAVLIYESV